MAEQQPEEIKFEEELRRYSRRDPFIPFDIVVASGDRYEVTSSLQIAISENTVVVALPKAGIQFFRKNQIVAVHVHETAS